MPSVIMFLARISRILFLFSIATIDALAQNISPEVNLESILIERTAGCFFKTLNSSDSLFNYNSPEEALDYFSAVDLRKRSSFGIQQDLSIRGSVFEDNEIYLEGMRINDPQTGHFSLELPLTEYDIDNITIDPNSQRAYFNIKEPKEKGIFFKHSWGGHALYEDSISLNFKTADANNRISYEHKISSGARQDTDFKIHNLSFDSLWEKGNNRINFIFGMTQRDFGAGSFYSSLYPSEEEHIRQKLFILKSNSRWDELSLVNKMFIRRHSDKFILNRNDPDIYTNHTTSCVYGWDSKLKFSGFYLGFLFNKEKMKSTYMGKHNRYKKSLYCGFGHKTNKTSLEVSFNEAYYGEFGWLEKALFNSSYKLNNKIALSFAFSYIWRPPSFTELYYWSPANHGNSNLDIQKASNYETGFRYVLGHNIDFHFAVFMRRQNDTIDWVKNSESSPWEAENIGSIKTKGVDCDLKIGLKKYSFEYLSLQYTYLTLNRKNPYGLSKYAFDYLKHKITANLLMKIHNFSINYILNFNNPLERKKYCVFSLKMVKEINDNMNFFIEGNNIFNTSYYELKDIRGDTRWYKLGITFRF